MLAYIILISGIINLILGIIVLLGSEEKGKNAFAFFSMATFFWALSVFFIYNSNFPIFVRLAYSAGSIVITSQLAWAYHFSSERTKIWKLLLIYATGLIFSILPFINGFIVYGVSTTSLSGNPLNFDCDKSIFGVVYQNSSIVSFVTYSKPV